MELRYLQKNQGNFLFSISQSNREAYGQSRWPDCVSQNEPQSFYNNPNKVRLSSVQVDFNNSYQPGILQHRRQNWDAVKVHLVFKKKSPAHWSTSWVGKDQWCPHQRGGHYSQMFGGTEVPTPPPGWRWPAGDWCACLWSPQDRSQAPRGAAVCGSIGEVNHWPADKPPWSKAVITRAATHPAEKTQEIGHTLTTHPLKTTWGTVCQGPAAISFSLLLVVL